MRGRRVNKHNRKTQCEDCLPLDARSLLPRRALHAGGWAGILTWPLPYPCDDATASVEVNRRGVRLRYGLEPLTRRPHINGNQSSSGEGSTSESEAFDYTIGILRTEQRLGGHRLWFMCPGVVKGQPCQRRVRILYLPHGAPYFLCRHCYGLAYRKSQEKGTKMEWRREYPQEHLAQLLEQVNGRAAST